MKVMVVNMPAYLKDNITHYVNAGSRWSHSIRASKQWSKLGGHYHPYPFELGYSLALLKRETDHKIKGLDGCAKDLNTKEFITDVLKFSPDVIITDLPTIIFPIAMKILRYLKKCLDCTIIVAGSHITALAREEMQRNSVIDYALLGEYELTLLELIKKLEKGKYDYEDLESIPGLAFRHEGEVTINQTRATLRDLDRLPFPDRDDFHPKDYHDFEIVGRPTIQMISSRGCAANCAFCVPRQVVYAEALVRTRKAERVVDEMELCKEKYKAKQIYFDDETMVMNRKHIKNICEEILKRKLDLPWACMADISVDIETIKLMAKAGCVGVKFGIETIDSSSLRAIGKHFVAAKIRKVREFVNLCKNLGIWTHATYTIGLPTDNVEKISKTICFSLQIGTDSAQFSIATPFPGTPFFELVKSNGWLMTENWIRYDGNNVAVVNYPWLSSQEIESLYMSAIKSYKQYFSLYMIKEACRNPRKVMRLACNSGFPTLLYKGIALVTSLL
jgi:radical SAM superfamily enzyme YgiQ (UPF0313 family)